MSVRNIAETVISVNYVTFYARFPIAQVKIYVSSLESMNMFGSILENVTLLNSLPLSLVFALLNEYILLVARLPPFNAYACT